MSKYYCECCNYSSNDKTKYNRHLSTKRHKKMENSYPKLSICYPKLSKNMEKKEKNQELYACKYCGKEFKYMSGVSKHIKYSCKQNKDEDLKELVRLLNEQNKDILQNLKEKDMEMKLKDREMEKMQRQIEKLSKKLQIQKIGTQNNIVNYNFKILNYNDTDYSHLTNTDYIKCISDCNHCVKSLIEKVHFNNTKPENMNVYIPSLKDNYIMVFKDNEWNIQDRQEILDDLYDKNEWTLESWYEEYKDTFPEIILSFERYLKNKEADNVVNDMKRKILMDFYNKRNMIIKNKDGNNDDLSVD